MKFNIRLLRSRQVPAWRGALFLSALQFIAPLLLTVLPASGDGCFVFKWNKAIDINEPTQKAIIVYDAGREDLLLQVRYEGPLEEFGWLVPVPGLPKVENGSMRPFQELDRLTQMESTVSHQALTLASGLGVGGKEEAVRVVEVKTVGAYEVAVLSAHDAGSLTNWLRSHDFSLPAGKKDIVEDYVRKGWHFVAAKVSFGKGAPFTPITNASTKDTAIQAKAREAVRKELSGNVPNPKDTEAQAKARQAMRQRLAARELPPLRISFDTPECVFPLRISAVGGKSADVSIYVLSTEPLINSGMFTKALVKGNLERARWAQNAEERSWIRERSGRSFQLMTLSTWMFYLRPPRQPGQRWEQDWSNWDLEAMSKEEQPGRMPEPLNDDPYLRPEELPRCLRAQPEHLSRSSKELPRLKHRGWWLTKQFGTFSPDEMKDLIFQPAIPFLASLLSSADGRAAAAVLRRFGDRAIPVLLTAVRSTNSVSRANASSAFPSIKDSRVTEALVELLHDESPHAKFNALMATAGNWDTKYVVPLIALFRDPYPQIRHQAVQRLCRYEPKDRSSVYLELLKDSDPDVRDCALHVLGRISPEAIPRAELVRLLNIPRFDTASLALALLQKMPLDSWSGQPDVRRFASQPQGETNRVSSMEAAALTTNRLTMARLMALKILRQNADADAIALTLPLLRDTNSIVRKRAFELLKTVSGQDFPPDDPAKWEQWWAKNRRAFEVR